MMIVRRNGDEEQLEGRSLEDRAFDLFGEMLLVQETDALLSEIEAEDAGRNTAEYDAFVARNRQRNLRTIWAYIRRQRMRGYIRPLKIAGQVAAVAVLTLTLAVAAVAGNKTVRVRVMQLLATHQEEYTELRLQEDESASFDVPAEWKGENYPAYIPEGMEVYNVIAFYGMNAIEYEDLAHPGKKLNFHELGPDTETNVDTEDATLKPTFIRGHPAMLYTEENRVGIYWDNGQYYFLIVAEDIDEADVLRMAESVVRVN